MCTCYSTAQYPLSLLVWPLLLAVKPDNTSQKNIPRIFSPGFGHAQQTKLYWAVTFKQDEGFYFVTILNRETAVGPCTQLLGISAAFVVKDPFLQGCDSLKSAVHLWDSWMSKVLFFLISDDWYYQLGLLLGQ